jgi:hypothetical protein
MLKEEGMAEERSKTGNGAFWLRVNDDSSVDTRCGSERENRFDSVQAAYDFHRGLAADPGDWNISYHLEDFL